MIQTKLNRSSKIFKYRLLIFCGMLGLGGAIAGSRADAQISSDDTLSTEVDRSNNSLEISGGTAKGNNLFHSFQEFSLPSGNTAQFNNSLNIENIIGRVTGGSISEINGLIRANGDANLILINPAGINFGSEARLDIGGSFLGSTASSLVFADGTVFTATKTSNPLLTVSVPVGLQLGQNSGSINVEGEGHNLSLETTVFSHLTRGNVGGLKVNSGETLALVGNDLTLTGGTLTAETGKVELGSVAQGTVGLTTDNWTLNYSDVSLFGNIDLREQSLADVSGVGSGAIALWGKQILIEDGSAVLAQNFGNRPAGNISVNATESLTLIGTEPTGEIASGLYSETIGEVQGANIEVVTRQLTIEDGASIISTTSSNAPGGNVSLNAADSMRFTGFSAVNPNVFSVVSVQTFGAGNAGNVSAATRNFTALDGANISSVTGSVEGTGSGGNINLEASETVELVGVNPLTFAPSQITAGSGSSGKAGNVTIDTSRLIIRDSGRVDASATAIGNAGNININAAESIEIAGIFPGAINPSLITASANILDPALRELFNLPDIPTGDAGSIDITTPELQVRSSGEVTVRNDGTGDAGNLSIASAAIELSSGGGINAVVLEGTGGAIDLRVNGALNLTDRGRIISDNFGQADGGEIRINSNSLSISDESYISTTSFGSGKGGNVVLDINESVNIVGTGYEQFQRAFQINALGGTLLPETRGTGIFIGTANSGMSGNLQLNTDYLSLREGGIIFSPIFTEGVGGDLEINTEDLEISGSALQISAGADSTNSAVGGNIAIDTQRLVVQEGGTIINATFGDATGGNININAAESVLLENTPENYLIFTGIYAKTIGGKGNGGDIALNTERLKIDDALISSNTGIFFHNGLAFEEGGNSGNISIRAVDTVEISGFPIDARFASGISSSTVSTGEAGNIEIFTDKLLVEDGSEVAAITIGSGDGGDLTIEATDSIELIGTTTMNNMQRGGLIAASGRETFPQQQASGASGDINVTANSLTIEQGAGIDVQSIDTGSAGNLDIQVDGLVFLDDSGKISAETARGTGGNIKIAADNIFWLGNSTTTATASNQANGGNIEIVADNSIALQGSQLTADADAGRGGNIDVDAKGLFICQTCGVSASSRLGIDGVVNIQTLIFNPDFEAVDLPIQLAQPESAVDLACSSNTGNGSSLTVNGRGGLPPRPSEVLSSKSLVEFADSIAQDEARESIPVTKLPAPARSWHVDSQGKIILTASSAKQANFNSPGCHVQ